MVPISPTVKPGVWASKRRKIRNEVTVGQRLNKVSAETRPTERRHNVGSDKGGNEGNRRSDKGETKEKEDNETYICSFLPKIPSFFVSKAITRDTHDQDI